MCGIVGLIHQNPNRPVDHGVLARMRDTLRLRGPDDAGLFVSGQVGLGQRRLAIIDLAGGHQPMTWEEAGLTVVFNGEIYNFGELKEELQKLGHRFVTHSDTEVILHAWRAWGTKALERFNGMFAFALWDAQARELILARDRMGKKPLYTWSSPLGLVFASEPKAILAHPDFIKDIDPVALVHYLQYEYVPAPFAIYAGIEKIPAAHFMIWREGRGRLARYWHLPLGQPIDGAQGSCDEKGLAAGLLAHLHQAVRRRLISDVPLGVFLSGGIDSSAVVAMMARDRPGHDIKSFSINFQEKSFDESTYSRLVSRHFRTDHHEETLSAGRLLAVLPEVVAYLDEPFADASVIPTYLLSAFTRRFVTVALAGDGGDELFAGYPTFQADRLARWVDRGPRWLWQGLLRRCVNALPVSTANFSWDFKLKRFFYGTTFSPLVRHQAWIGSFDAGQIVRLLADKKRVFADPLALILTAMQGWRLDHADQVLAFYQLFYLCDDILVKSDRASMARSLEARAPFLDVDLINFVSRLPYHLKWRRNQGKYLLKRALHGILPDVILHRPKKGFGIPVAQWLKGPLRTLAEDKFSPERLRRQGLLDADEVGRYWREHSSGKADHRKQLWTLLMLQLWYDHYLA